MKLSNFTRYVIYALSSVCLGNSEFMDGQELTGADHTKTEITISPPIGRENSKIEDDFGETSRRNSNQSDSDEDNSVSDSSTIDEEVSDEEEDIEETDITKSEAFREENSKSMAEDLIEDSVEEASDTDESEDPKTAGVEMGHGVGNLSKVEEEFWDNFQKGTAGHWIELRNFTRKEIINICESVHRDEYGSEIVAYYRALRRLRWFKVRLSDEQIENLETDVLECIVETLEDKGHNFKVTTFYVAEGSSPKNVFKLRKSDLPHYPPNILEVYGRTNDVVY